LIRRGKGEVVVEAKTPSICLQLSETAVVFRFKKNTLPYLNHNFPGVF
jgi:hypothetical protein